MDNPYQSPKSKLITNEVVFRRKILWKIFTIFMITQYFLIVVMSHDLSNPLSQFGYMGVITDLIIYPIVLVGLFGFAWNRRILVSEFWVLIMLLALAADTYRFYNWYIVDGEQFFSDLRNLVGLERDSDLAFLKELFLIVLIIMPIIIFQYIALYGYSKQSPEIWKYGGA